MTRSQTSNRNIPSPGPLSPKSEVIVLTTDIAQPYLRSHVLVIGGIEYCAPISFDDVPPKDFKTIASITLFTRQMVFMYAENDYEAL